MARVAGLHYAIAGCRATPVTLARRLGAAASSSDVQSRLQSLRQSMADALELAESVGPSAAQLLLETDPAARGPREQYEQHYAEMALAQLQSALSQYHQLRESLGDEAARAVLKREKLAVTAADCQLARDRMQQLISSVQRRQQANEVSCPD